MSNTTKVILSIITAIYLLILSGFSWHQPNKATIDVGLTTLEEKNTPKLLPIKKDDIIKISSGFGKTTKSGDKSEHMHEGIDFIASKGTKILATANGEVVYSGFSEAYGNHVIIKHNSTYQSLYAHLSSLTVEKGKNVNAKEVIGIIGSTGKATGIHLHYEVIKNGIKINPNRLFNK